MKLSLLTGALLLQTMTALALTKDPFSVDAKLHVDGTSSVLKVTFMVPPLHHVYADKMQVEPVGAQELAPLDIPPAEQKQDAFSDSVVGVYEHDVTFTYGVRGDTSTGMLIRVKYQGCSEKECFFPATKTMAVMPGPGVVARPDVTEATAALAPMAPTTRSQGFSVAGRATGYMGTTKFLQFLDDAEAGRGMGKDKLHALFEKKGIWIWGAVILILLGGLSLNLTPCVLPMIPINIAIIGAGAQAGSRTRGMALGSIYGAGIALAYGGLGLFVVLTGAKFGALNSSPVFNGVVASIFVVLALAMFDIIRIDLSRYQGMAGQGAKRGGFATAFFMGAVSALLAGACVAPVVVSVLLLATDLYRGSYPIGLLLPFLLGVGMALPWPFAGAGLSLLPKPGRWMENVKRAFGVLILLMAAWYGYESYSLARDRSETHRAETAAAQKEAAESKGWMTSLDDALARAEKEQKLLIVDFWASWCKNCLTMERTTFKDAEVNRRLEPYVRLKFQAEELDDAQVKPVLDRYEVVGLPTYVILKPSGGARGTAGK